MDKYIKYLIEDIRKASKYLPLPPYLDLPEDKQALRGVIEYETTTEKPMQEWFKLSKENFPPVGILNNRQLEILVKEILKLWNAFNFEPVLPKNLPVDMTYQLLVDYFEKPVIWVSEGTIMIEFCEHDPQNCPFPNGYCRCTEFDNNAYEEDTNDNTREIRVLNQEIEAFFANKERKFKPNKKIQRYVDQLIGDLLQKAKEVLERPAIPDNIEIRSIKDQLDMVEKPFVTLEMLSGIKQIAFPEVPELDGIQISRLLIAILQFFDAYKLKIFHPDGIPAEAKYDAITSEWDNIYVKDMPISGDDIDLCTGDKQSCPYSCYCNCEDEMEDEFEEEDGPDLEQMDRYIPFDDEMEDKNAEDDDELPF
jgi:hypothetical protein